MNGRMFYRDGRFSDKTVKWLDEQPINVYHSIMSVINNKFKHGKNDKQYIYEWYFNKYMSTYGLDENLESYNEVFNYCYEEFIRNNCVDC